jgi:hypothetical protein
MYVRGRACRGYPTPTPGLLPARSRAQATPSALAVSPGGLASRAMVVRPCCRAGRARRQPGLDASKRLGILGNNQLESERAEQCRQADRPKNPHRLRAQQFIHVADSQPGQIIERDAGNVQLVTARPQRLDQPAIVPNGRKRSGARMLHACCPGVAPNGDAGTRQR